MTGSRTNNKDKQGNPVVRYYYSCSNMRNKGAVVCKANSVRKQDAEEYLFDRLKEVLAKPQILRGIVKGINDRRSGNIQTRIDDIESRKSRLIDLYEMET
jgi:site-specific DNA recombinase